MKSNSIHAHKLRRRFVRYAGIVLFATAGLGLLALSLAGTRLYVAAEGESASRSGNLSVASIAGASGGSALRFDAAPTTPTPTPPPPPPPPSSSWPTSPPVQVCGNASILNKGPASVPAGAINVPAGNNSGVNFSLTNQTYWFAAGVHTLGDGEFSQIVAGAGSTYVGAPGAIIDGQNKNKYAFTQTASNVTIRYLTVRNFGSGLDNRDQGVVNHDSGDNWLVEYTTIENNDGAALMMGKSNTYRYNCLKNNGQYGINAFRCRSYGDFPDSCGGSVTDLVIDHNEITGNNTDDWETKINGCGCTGGLKLWDTSNVQLTNNYVHGNLSVGLWLDNNNRGVLIENNYISDNTDEAIWIEAGYDVKITRNNLQRNTWAKGRRFVGNSFVIGSVYVSENGSDPALSPKYFPLSISNNLFNDNWGGVVLWENADRYCASPAHTHGDYCTLYFGGGYDPTPCTQAQITSQSDIYKCRWRTMNLVIENNEFRINKATIGSGCNGATWCGKSGVYSNYGTYPSWSPFKGFAIAQKITHEQNNVFKNNSYFGDWWFKAYDQGSGDINWATWRAAPFNQDAGSTKQ